VRSLFADRDFRILASATIVSAAGSQISLIAIPLTGLLICHATAAQVGSMVALGYLPYLFVSPIAGLAIDRLSPKLVSIATDFSQCLILLLVPLLYLGGQLRIASLYEIMLVNGCVNVVGAIARRSGGLPRTP
jgi:hypothetical protein